MTEHAGPEGSPSGEPLAGFLNALASGEATPGGGAAAGVAGAMGAALVAMVCRLTIGRPKYAEVSDELSAVAAEADRLRGELLRLAAADADAYHAFSAALALPKATESERAARAEARRRALVGATEVPLRVVTLARRVADLAVPAAERGNQTARSDAVSAILLARAAAGISSLNVRTNLALLKDAAYAERVDGELTEHLDAIERAAGAVRAL